MLTETRPVLTLYVDRTLQQWVVRDADGNFWTVPSTADAWEQRQPYCPAADAELESIPGHYKYLLSLPF
jgi:hypothetical protein